MQVYLKKMVNLKVLVALFAIVFVFSYFSFSASVVKVNKSGYSTVSQSVYTSASTKAKKLGSLKKNQTVYIYAHKGNWSQVKYGKTKGWVAKKNLKLGKPLLTINEDAHALSTQFIYSSQSTKSKHLATVKKNQNVFVLSEQGTWYKIKSGKKTGWVVSKQFELGKIYSDGWVAPILKSEWNPKHSVNLETLQNELGFKADGSYGVKGLSQTITLSGESPESRDELEMTYYMWTSRSIPQSYRIPVVSKELFKLYFGKDYSKVWDYMNKNDVPENFTANGRKVHVYFSEEAGSLTFQIGKKK